MRFVAPDPDLSNGAGSCALSEKPVIVPAPELVAQWAHEALLREVDLTPKPGLVDRHNSGAHSDMDYDMFITSAAAIKPFFSIFYAAGAAHEQSPASAVLSAIRPIGISCEQAMFAATGNVNTHKGAIFSLGLFCTAAGRLAASGVPLTRQTLCNDVSAIAANLVKELMHATKPTTVGEVLFRRHGLAGIRGEAASGYATVRAHSLPVFDSMIAAGHEENTALLQCLLSLLANNEDSNLFGRGGLDGMAHVRRQASELLRDCGVLSPDGIARMAHFDDDLIARNLSPGGSADLLAVTWFLSRFPL